MTMFANNSAIQRGLIIAMRGVKGIMTYITTDYIVTVYTDPDCTGNYLYVGLWYMKPYYRREDSGWYLWYNHYLFRWTISAHWGTEGSNYWLRNSTEICGEYNPYGGADGYPLVSVA